jgi:C-terminal domain of tail specific protease (DUF3340)
LNYSDEIGETSLENPLPWDTIPSAQYDKLNLVDPYLADLRRDSDARLATNRDFAYIEQDIEQFKKLQADKTMSLNERDQIKERQANEARQKARDKERDARKVSDEKIYDITVENAEQPGLPVCETNVVDYAKISEGQLDEAARLRETEQMMQDYISLLSGTRTLIAN